MKRIILASLASAIALAAAAPASAAIIIGVGFNGGAVTQVATDGGTGSANYVSIANGELDNIGASGAPLLRQPSILTQSLNIFQSSNTAGTLNLYITQTDLSSFNGSLLSTFTSNTLTNATAVLRSFYSTSNALFGGTLLQSSAFNAIGMYSAANTIAVNAPFSTTLRYDITFASGGGNFNGTANLTTAAVPEPATWAMMLFGLAGVGYVLRRRPKVGARIRFA